MKILFITHSFPYPPDEGIKLLSYNLIKQFSGSHEVSLASIIESDPERNYIKNLGELCRKIEVVEMKVPKSPFLRLWNILFQKYPFCVYQFYSKDFADKINEMIKEGNYDILHFIFVNTSIYRNYSMQIPAVYSQVDAMSMLFYKNIAKEKNLLRKIYTYTQYRKMLRYEAETIGKFHKTTVVSPVDKEWILSRNPGLELEVVTYGVDEEYFSPADAEDDYPSVVFRGIMSFMPNIDAALYFSNEIFPLILKQIPGTKFLIVGKDPVKEILKLGERPNIKVLGYVEDIRPYMARASVNICPMRIGSGIKNKILEAMAMGKAIVATKMACAGIDITEGENIMIGNGPVEFAEKTVKLLKDREAAKRIGRNARGFVTKNHSWKKTAGVFEELYREATGSISIIQPE
jgi:polysaccharide biosynthesis protein PslH